MPNPIEIVGVYPIEADQPVHLIELIVRDCRGPIDMMDITQAIPRQSRDNWQVPYEERILDPAGQVIAASPYDAEWNRPDTWQGDVRLAFFFHDLELEQPLQTPFGAVPLPAPTALPSRLSVMAYEPVD